MAKPGVMLYFDIRPGLAQLTTEQRGQLFDAILDFAEYGVEPKVDGMVALAWAFIKPRIVRDSDAYDLKAKKSRYATYIREQKKKSAEPLSFAAWEIECDSKPDRSISDDSGRYPTANAESTPTTKTNSAISSTQIPTVDEVRSYCSANGLNVDPAYFVAFYTARGWEVNGSRIVDWKSAAYGWHLREQKKQQGNTNGISQAAVPQIPGTVHC